MLHLLQGNVAAGPVELLLGLGCGDGDRHPHGRDLHDLLGKLGRLVLGKERLGLRRRRGLADRLRYLLRRQDLGHRLLCHLAHHAVYRCHGLDGGDDAVAHQLVHLRANVAVALVRYDLAGVARAGLSGLLACRLPRLRPVLGVALGQRQALGVGHDADVGAVLVHILLIGNGALHQLFVHVAGCGLEFVAAGLAPLALLVDLLHLANLLRNALEVLALEGAPRVGDPAHLLAQALEALALAGGLRDAELCLRLGDGHGAGVVLRRVHAVAHGVAVRLAVDDLLLAASSSSGHRPPRLVEAACAAREPGGDVAVEVVGLVGVVVGDPADVMDVLGDAPPLDAGGLRAVGQCPALLADDALRPGAPQQGLEARLGVQAEHGGVLAVHRHDGAHEAPAAFEHVGLDLLAGDRAVLPEVGAIHHLIGALLGEAAHAGHVVELAGHGRKLLVLVGELSVDAALLLPFPAAGVVVERMGGLLGHAAALGGYRQRAAQALEVGMADDHGARRVESDIGGHVSPLSSRVRGGS